jgi:hypothetical protein
VALPRGSYGTGLLRGLTVVHGYGADRVFRGCRYPRPLEHRICDGLRRPLPRHHRLRGLDVGDPHRADHAWPMLGQEYGRRAELIQEHPQRRQAHVHVRPCTASSACTAWLVRIADSVGWSGSLLPSPRVVLLRLGARSRLGSVDLSLYGAQLGSAGALSTEPSATSALFTSSYSSYARSADNPASYELTTPGSSVPTITVEAWFARQTDARLDLAGHAGFIGVSAENRPEGPHQWIFALRQLTHELLFRVRVQTGGYHEFYGQRTEWPIGQWMHIAFTYDGTTAQFYVNGERDGAPLTYTGVPAARVAGSVYRLSAGGWGFTASPGVPGRVEEVAVYPTVITQEKLRARYQDATGVAPSCTGAPNVNYVGNNILYRENVPTAADCADFCLATAGCVVWEWHTTEQADVPLRCWAKNAVATPTVGINTLAGGRPTAPCASTPSTPGELPSSSTASSSPSFSSTAGAEPQPAPGGDTPVDVLPDVYYAATGFFFTDAGCTNVSPTASSHTRIDVG